jgi:hypothetical protein
MLDGGHGVRGGERGAGGIGEFSERFLGQWRHSASRGAPAPIARRTVAHEKIQWGNSLSAPIKVRNSLPPNQFCVLVSQLFEAFPAAYALKNSAFQDTAGSVWINLYNKRCAILAPNAPKTLVFGGAKFRHTHVESRFTDASHADGRLQYLRTRLWC